jgi:hypothetical protein
MCSQGLGQLVPATSSTDRVCRPCHSGVTFSGGGTSPCQNVTACSSSEYALVPATEASDNVCVALSECRAGTFEYLPPTVTTDRGGCFSPCEAFSLPPPLPEPFRLLFHVDAVLAHVLVQCAVGAVPVARRTWWWRRAPKNTVRNWSAPPLTPTPRHLGLAGQAAEGWRLIFGSALVLTDRCDLPLVPPLPFRLIRDWHLRSAKGARLRAVWRMQARRVRCNRVWRNGKHRVPAVDPVRARVLRYR